jgi:hypothetical protein
MKSILTIFLLLLALKTLAPEVKNDFIIFVSDPIEPYDRLIKAVVHVESLGDTMAYNLIEEAAGAFQIRPIRLRDYNQKTNKNYKLKDRYNFRISKEIFLYYAKQIGFSDYETIAKNWNGSGKATLEYWRKVELHL